MGDCTNTSKSVNFTVTSRRVLRLYGRERWIFDWKIELQTHKIFTRPFSEKYSRFSCTRLAISDFVFLALILDGVPESKYLSS